MIKHILLILLVSFYQILYTQKETPQSTNTTADNNFESLFFEALKQKSIENYDLAIDALHKCLAVDDTKTVVYYELGKNYTQLKKYIEAEKALEKAIELDSSNLWFYNALYAIYFQQGNIEKSIFILEKLVHFNSKYKKDLAALYVKNQSYEKALKILDELEAEFGQNEKTTTLRNDIYNATGKTKKRVAFLEKQAKNNPNNKDLQLKLIYGYNELGEHQKTFSLAKTFLKQNPDNKPIHIALYKFYLESNKSNDAINSIKKVIAAPEIDATTKAKVLEDFMRFLSTNPEYENDLSEIILLAKETNDHKVLLSIASYYLTAGDKEKAKATYIEVLKNNPDDINTLKSLALIYMELKDFNGAILTTENALEIFPAQPIFYLVNGMAHNRRVNYQMAIESLEMGLEFLVDDPKMEINFYQELSVSYSGLNNTAKAKTFDKKAADLKIQK